MGRIKIICFFIICLCNSAVQAQSVADTIFISGYLVREYDLHNVKKSERDLKARVKGMDFTIPVDKWDNYTFYPVSKNENIVQLVVQGTKHINIYMPFNTNQVWLRKSLLDRLGIKRIQDECIICNNSPYIKINGVKKKLFKVYYIEGNWVQIQINSTNPEFFSLLRERSANQNIQNDEVYNVFIMISCKMVQRYVDFKSDKRITITNYVD